MFDCSSEIRKFHDDSVRLPQTAQDTLRGNRKSNQERLVNSLTKSDNPIPFRFVKQGSYAMKTMVQRPENDYDIDDGALFHLDDLKDKEPSAAKKMVCDALQHEAFKTPPKVLDNCVRIFYEAGHHVDVPVYRAEKDSEQGGFELASKDWKKSDPEGVTNWFEKCLKDKTSSADSGKQLRRLVRLLKAFACSRSGWDLPSGLVLTVLVNENYSAYEQREDKALFNVMQAIKNRLDQSMNIKHPVVDESLSDGCEKQLKELLQRLNWALEELTVLGSQDCTKARALKSWKSVFNTEYFDRQIEEELAEASVRSIQITDKEPKAPVDKSGGNRFG